MNPTFLLDTNICIYIRQRRPAQILQRFRRLKVGEAAISVITYGELIYAAEKSEQREAAIGGLKSLPVSCAFYRCQWMQVAPMERCVRNWKPAVGS